MKLASRFTILFLLVNALTACTHFKPTPGELDSVHQLNQWSFSGKLGIQAPDHQSGSGVITYTQNGNAYHLRFVGPIGQGRVEIIRSKNTTTLILPEGRYQDTDAETLIKRHLSWHLPIEHLRYWVRGLASPLAPAEKLTLTNNGGNATAFTQDGWLITPSHYSLVDQYPMPHKVLLQQILQEKGWRFTLIVKQWTLE